MTLKIYRLPFVAAVSARSADKWRRQIWILGKMWFHHLKMIETQIEQFANKYQLLYKGALKHMNLQDEPFLSSISPQYVKDGVAGISKM